MAITGMMLGMVWTIQVEMKNVGAKLPIQLLVEQQGNRFPIHDFSYCQRFHIAFQQESSPMAVVVVLG
eukprot:3482881-Amphidinium_carterae.1